MANGITEDFNDIRSKPKLKSRPQSVEVGISDRDGPTETLNQIQETSFSEPNDSGDESTCFMTEDNNNPIQCSNDQNSSSGKVVSLHSQQKSKVVQPESVVTTENTIEDEPEKPEGKLSSCNCSGNCFCKWMSVISVISVLVNLFMIPLIVYNIHISIMNNRKNPLFDSTTPSSKDTQLIRNLKTSIRVEINWNLTVISNKRSNITWKEFSSHFVSLDKTSSIFHVTENGTYSLSLLLTFDSRNNKRKDEVETARYRSLVCLKFSRDAIKTSCLRVRLPPNTARTEHLPVYVLLHEGDSFWFSASGLDIVYPSNTGNYLSIARKN